MSDNWEHNAFEEVLNVADKKTVRQVKDNIVARRMREVEEDAVAPVLKKIQSLVNHKEPLGGAVATLTTGIVGASGQGGKRVFATGANRNDDEAKPDYEGYLSPLVIEVYGAYMLKHGLMEDGSRRDSDNWQKGMPLNSYMKSLWRHFMDHWRIHRRGLRPEVETDEARIEALCGVLFNAMGYLHEVLAAREVLKEPVTTNTGLRAQMERDIARDTR